MDPELQKLISEAEGLYLAYLNSSYTNPAQPTCARLAQIFAVLLERRNECEAYWKAVSGRFWAPPAWAKGKFGSHLSTFEYWRRLERFVDKGIKCIGDGAHAEPWQLHACIQKLRDAHLDYEKERERIAREEEPKSVIENVLAFPGRPVQVSP